MQAIEVVPLIKARAKARAAIRPNASKGSHYWHAAFELWTDEFDTAQALTSLGHTNASRCAWERRTAAAELCQILTACT